MDQDAASAVAVLIPGGQPDVDDGAVRISVRTDLQPGQNKR
jgi:hypothetical protein